MSLSTATSSLIPLSTFTTQLSSASTFSTSPFISTIYLPLTSPFYSPPECSSQFYEISSGSLIAFDPFYEVFISPSGPTCLPPQVTFSWQHDFDPVFYPTPVALGPAFACPDAYSTIATEPVNTLAVNSNTQSVLCCPSSYSLNMPIFADILTTLPSQCVSALSSGQILTYQSPVGTSWTPAIITLSQTSVAWGMQVKGIQTADANGNFPMDPEDVVGAPSDPRAFWGGFAGVLVGVTGLIVSAVIFRRWLSRRKYREGRIVEDGGGQHVR